MALILHNNPTAHHPKGSHSRRNTGLLPKLNMDPPKDIMVVPHQGNILSNHRTVLPTVHNRHHMVLLPKRRTVLHRHSHMALLLLIQRPLHQATSSVSESITTRQDKLKSFNKP